MAFPMGLYAPILDPLSPALSHWRNARPTPLCQTPSMSATGARSGLCRAGEQDVGLTIVNAGVHAVQLWLHQLGKGADRRAGWRARGRLHGPPGGFRSSGPELVLLGALPTDRVPGATSSIRRCSDVRITAYADRYPAIDRLRACASQMASDPTIKATSHK